MDMAPVPASPGPLVCRVAVSKMIAPVVFTRIVEPEVPSKFDPEAISAEAASIVREPPEVVMVPAVVTLELASMSMSLPAVIVPPPVETLDAELEITTS